MKLRHFDAGSLRLSWGVGGVRSYVEVLLLQRELLFLTLSIGGFSEDVLVSIAAQVHVFAAELIRNLPRKKCVEYAMNLRYLNFTHCAWSRARNSHCSYLAELVHGAQTLVEAVHHIPLESVHAEQRVGDNNFRKKREELE